MWALLCLVTLLLVGHRRPTPAGAQTAPPPGQPYPAKAWILVDADTGKVLDAFNEHEALPPASTQKIMTALVAAEKLPGTPPSPWGPSPPPRRPCGSAWRPASSGPSAPPSTPSMMVSANDAAYALAEARLRQRSRPSPPT